MNNPFLFNLQRRFRSARSAVALRHNCASAITIRETTNCAQPFPHRKRIKRICVIPAADICFPEKSRRNPIPLLSARTLCTYTKVSDTMRAMRGGQHCYRCWHCCRSRWRRRHCWHWRHYSDCCRATAATTSRRVHTIESPDHVPSDDNRLLSLFIQAPSKFWQSEICLEISSYCFGRIQPCSIDNRAIYPSSFKSVIALRW